MTGRLKDKVILITGGAGGIGSATALLAAREGARVVITDLSAARGEQAAAEIGHGTLFLEQDVRDEARWQDVVDAVLRHHGRLDGLVNNAGIGVRGSIVETSLEDWRFVHAVNTEGVFLGCKHGILAMRETGGGSIVNLSSVAGLIGAPDLTAYCSSKGAVRLLTKSVAVWCAEQKNGIRVNSVHPSFLMTPMVQMMIDTAPDPAMAHKMLSRAAPMGRLGEPEDAAAMIVFLLSDEAGFMTGGEYVVDGGLTAR